MKILFFSFLLCLQAKAEITSWRDIELRQILSLNTEIPISKKITLKPSQKFRLDEFYPEDHFFYYVFKNLDCDDQNLSAELVIHHDVGVAIQKDCNVGMYIEPFQYYDDSFFLVTPH